MQKVIEFRKTRFLGGVDIAALNDRIQELNQDGWKVINAVPLTGFMAKCTVIHYLLKLTSFK